MIVNRPCLGRGVVIELSLTRAIASLEPQVATYIASSELSLIDHVLESRLREGQRIGAEILEDMHRYDEEIEEEYFVTGQSAADANDFTFGYLIQEEWEFLCDTSPTPGNFIVEPYIRIKEAQRDQGNNDEFNLRTLLTGHSE